MTDEKDNEFKVTDRRKFNPDGTPRDGEREPEAPRDSPATEAATAEVVSFPSESTREPIKAERHVQGAEAAAAQEHYQRATGRFSEASFLELVNMLGVEAALHLGLVPTPDGKTHPVDREAARHMIDILGLLYEKTSGNLSNEENRLFEDLLADLRMQFVQIATRSE